MQSVPDQVRPHMLGMMAEPGSIAIESFSRVLGTALLAKALVVRHIGSIGEVAEWLKAAVC